MSSRGEALATAEDGGGQVDAPGARPADAATIRLAIDGMHCANCAANIEKHYREAPGVIDVAVNRDEAGRLCGDVDCAAAAEKASFITPVPGGTGPVTRAVLMENVLSAALAHGKK